MSGEQKRKLLLIDDDTSLLITLSDFLRFEGYDVITAESGEKGLAVLKTVTPELIILDMSMPGMGGIGFLKEILDEKGKPLYPVLVLTARSNMAEFFANVEIDGFIAKPCDPQDLLMEVGRIIFLRRGEIAEESLGETRRRRMILGESDPDVAEGMVSWFSKNGYIVEQCAKGPEALESSIVNRPDVIVMNQILEGLNGSAVADMLMVMPNTRKIPIVLYAEKGIRMKPSSGNSTGGGVVATVESSRAADVGRVVNAVFD
jgi:CheY-like chemotaxis protein